MKKSLLTFIALFLGIFGAYANCITPKVVDPHKVIKAATRGDVNGDGSVTIADVTALVNIILGSTTTPSDDAENVADVNQDGSVTIADVTALVNIILGNTGGNNDDPDTPGISDDPIDPGVIIDESRNTQASNPWDE